MPDGIYTALLKKAETQLTAITGFAALSLVPKLRREPSFEMLQDQLPQLVLAPSGDLAEEVVEMTFAGGDGTQRCWLAYTLYVGLATNAEWDRLKLFWRLDRREDIRLAMWRDTLIVLDEDDRHAFRCDYNPAPGVPRSTPPKQIDESWQSFRYLIETPQHGD